MLTSMRNLVAAVAIIWVPPGSVHYLRSKTNPNKTFLAVRPCFKDLGRRDTFGAMSLGFDLPIAPLRSQSSCAAASRGALCRNPGTNVSKSNSITVRPCRVWVNAIKQVSKNPFQPVHSSAPRKTRTAPHHDCHEWRLLTGMRPAEGRLAATAHDIVFRSAPPSRRHH